MKKTLTMILALVLFTLCSTSAFAQKHRHTDRSNATETVSNTPTVTNESHDTVTLINTNGLKVEVTRDEMEQINQALDEFSQAMGEFGQSMGEFGESMDETDSDEEGQLVDAFSGTLNNTVGKLGEGHFFDYALLIPIIAVIGLFFGPVLIVGFILLYKYKRKKQRDQVVMAAINKGVEIPEDYRSGTTSANSNPQASTPVSNELMNKGIRRSVLGIAFCMLGVFIDLGGLIGIGFFFVALGAGDILIYYFNNRGSGSRNEGNYNQKPTTNDSLQKNEGTYEKSE